VLGAFDLLNAKPELGFQMHLSAFQIFIWISISGMLGVLLAVPLRKHFIDEEKLTFADGTAAGESLVILDSGSADAKKQVRYLTWGAAASAVVAWLTQGMPQLVERLARGLPKETLANPELHPSAMKTAQLFTFAENSTAYVILPSILVENGWVAEAKYKPVLLWVMWPATGLLVVGGLTGLALKWKAVVKTFADMRKGSMTSGTDFPLKWVGIGVAVLSVTLIVVQYFSLGVAPWESALAILISVVLMLVGIRVLGETNWAPISAMANMVQAMFALISPGSIGVNMVASGMSGTVAGAGEHLMQDYKAGKIIGSNNRSLTVMQLIATPVGAGAIAIVYPLLRSMYGMGPDRYGIANPASQGTGLASPISVKWAGFAELLMGGIEKLPKYSGWALLIASVLAVLITLGETTRFKHHLPSPTGMALGMLIPAMYVVPMVVGAYIQLVWSKTAPKHEESFNTPLASGFIVGEAMVVLVVALLVMMGLLGAEG
ncbi:MAG: oligopeptide transporter, superfamily, partial [Myxococcaceae bacterium]|nr:oligopeptide transporter, superfamily [Myxococcaceae bacterium]